MIVASESGLLSAIAHALLVGALLVTVAAGLFAATGLILQGARRSTTRLRAREARGRRHHYQQMLLLALSGAALCTLCLTAIQDIPALRYARAPDHVTAALDRVQRIEQVLAATQNTAAVLQVAMHTFEAKLDRALPTCNGSDSPPHLRLRQLGVLPEFPPGRAVCGELPKSAADGIETMAHEISEVAMRESVHGIYVIGGHDIRPLTDEARATYENNAVLALRRATCVANALRQELNPPLQDTPIIPMFDAPDHLGPRPTDDGLAADRQTVVTLLSAPRSSAAVVGTEVSDARP